MIYLNILIKYRENARNMSIRRKKVEIKEIYQKKSFS
jgi:hypothetical protein